MSTRLQIVVDEAELSRFRRAARAEHMTLSEWARQVLRRAERATSSADPARKLRALRASAEFEFPAPDIEQMLEEIERGRNDSDVR